MSKRSKRLDEEEEQLRLAALHAHPNDTERAEALKMKKVTYSMWRRSRGYDADGSNAPAPEPTKPHHMRVRAPEEGYPERVAFTTEPPPPPHRNRCCDPHEPDCPNATRNREIRQRNLARIRDSASLARERATQGGY